MPGTVTAAKVRDIEDTRVNKDLRALAVTADNFAAAHEFVDDVTADEVTGAGYSRQTLGTKSAAVVDTDDAKFVCASIALGSIATGETLVGVWIYEHVNDDTDSLLVSYHPFAAPIPTNGASITATISGTDGLAKLVS